jgi:hypothetical protein
VSQKKIIGYFALLLSSFFPFISVSATAHFISARSSRPQHSFHSVKKRPPLKRRRRLRRALRVRRVNSHTLSTLNIPVAFTKTYSKFFGIPCIMTNENQELTRSWEQDDVMPFNELIVSWNALRPVCGSFIFKASVKTIHGWSAPCRFAEWKADTQKTFANTRVPNVHTKNVRLEVQNNLMGRGFKITVEARGGADISNIHALFGCVSDFSKYKINHGIKNLAPVVLKDVPRQSQMVLNHPRNKDMCCPTSMAMVVHYFNKKYDEPDLKPLNEEAVSFARAAHDDGIDKYGSWALNVAQAYEAAKGRVFFRVERLNSFKDLHDYLLKKIPVSVSVRGMIRGGAKTYASGHYMVVVGWNPEKETVLCIDPAFHASNRTLRAYSIQQFLAAWSRSHNMSYISIPKQAFAEEAIL